MSKSLGRYFTKNEDLQRKVSEWIEHQGRVILEPSVGMGDLLAKIYEENPVQEVVAVEIDCSLEPRLNEHSRLIRGDFLKIDFEGRFQTIISNPPFVTRRGERNTYLDFVERCHELLEEDGELIMILPSDFFRLTSSGPILKSMLATGSFTHLYVPDSENLFEGASIHVACFRYRRGVFQSTVLYNDSVRNVVVRGGMVLFQTESETGVGAALGDLFHVCVGIVSGCDRVFRNEEFGNILVRESEDRVSRFILCEAPPEPDSELHAYLRGSKDLLISRGIRKFTEDNWFEWGALRNIEKMRSMMGRPCIYVKTLTRSPVVAFPGVVEYFGGGLICLIPKPEFGNRDLESVVEYLCGEEVERSFRFGGRFKIGQRHLCQLGIPGDVLVEPSEGL